jgi:hypothetical protein
MMVKEEEELRQRPMKESDMVQKLQLDLQRAVTETSNLGYQQVWRKETEDLANS